MGFFEVDILFNTSLNGWSKGNTCQLKRQQFSVTYFSLHKFQCFPSTTRSENMSGFCQEEKYPSEHDSDTFMSYFSTSRSDVILSIENCAVN